MGCADNHLTITILETSDVHGYILPVNYANNEVIEAGLSKASTVIKREREKEENLILIDNGDAIQGTPLTYYYSKIDSTGMNPVIEVMNYLEYDAAVIGNHEFNYGQEILKRAISDSSFPWLSANIKDDSNGEPYYGKPYIIREFRDNLRVAVLGLTTSYIPNWENPRHIEGLDFSNAVEAASKWVTYLKEEEKADVVIVSYHGGFERDVLTGEATQMITGENVGYEICMKVPGIDVLLTGHQHRSLSGVRVNGVIILQPGGEGKGIGKVTVELSYEEKWKVTDKHSEIINLEGIASDSNIHELIKEYEEKTQKWLDTPIGKTKGDMTVKDAFKIRLKDNPLIEFFNKVQMINSGAEISAAALFHDKAPGLKGDVTMRDIVSNYIYPNTLRVIRIKGQDIKDALERSAEYFERYNGEDIKVDGRLPSVKTQPYNYDMWEGVEYKINVSRSEGNRIVELKYKGKALDLDKEYEVVMNNYRASGGGEYHMFKNKTVVKDIPTDVAELIANFILEKKVINAEVNNNWEVIHD